MPISPSSRSSSVPRDIESIGDDSLASCPMPADVDPLDLATKIVSHEQLKVLRTRGRSGKRVAGYYQRQNKRIDQLLKPLDEQALEAQERANASRISVRIAVHASLVANLALCILQLYAALTSRSLSLIATAIDSVFDIGSNVLLYWVHKRATQLDRHRWPLGGGRVETVGNIVFGSLMSAVNLVVVVESVHLLFDRYAEGKLMPFHVPSLVGVAAALGLKLLLFLYCSPLRRISSQVQMLWEDHRNDIFINGFGLLMSAGGSKLVWFLDPVGGVIIGSVVIAMWTWTLYGLFRSIAGVSAPDAEVRVVLYQALIADGPILHFRDLKVYYNGDKLSVEITAVFSPSLSICEAHLAGVQLRKRLQTLPQVESALILIEPDLPVAEYRSEKLGAGR